MPAPLSGPVRLLLLRHAEVEPAYQRVFGGSIDMNLSEHGREQAEVLARFLSRRALSSLYSSPMKRARQTLEPVAKALGIQAEIRPELSEVDFGDWTGLSWKQVGERHGVSAFDWLDKLDQAAIPNGECGGRFRARIEPCIRQILEVSAGRRVGVLCHGGVIRMILSILLELPLPKTACFEIDYASVTELHLHPHRTEVQVLNLTPWRDLE
jgi:broad specificity phosphatase PhoE